MLARMNSSSPQTHASKSDEQLMAMAQRNDDTAFAELYQRHSSVIFGLTRRMAGSGALAEDALQEAFLSIWRHRGAYRPDRGNVRGWMISIARNRTIDLTRKHRRHQRPVGDDGNLLEHEVAPERTEVQFMAREDGRIIRQALKTLPADQASSIALAYYGGLTHQEIGKLAEVPLGTVKGRIRLGLTKLRAEMEPVPQPA